MFRATVEAARRMLLRCPGHPGPLALTCSNRQAELGVVAAAPWARRGGKLQAHAA